MLVSLAHPFFLAKDTRSSISFRPMPFPRHLGVHEQIFQIAAWCGGPGTVVQDAGAETDHPAIVLGYSGTSMIWVKNALPSPGGDGGWHAGFIERVVASPKPEPIVLVNRHRELRFYRSLRIS